MAICITRSYSLTGFTAIGIRNYTKSRVKPPRMPDLIKTNYYDEYRRSPTLTNARAIYWQLSSARTHLATSAASGQITHHPRIGGAHIHFSSTDKQQSVKTVAQKFVFVQRLRRQFRHGLTIIIGAASAQFGNRRLHAGFTGRVRNCEPPAAPELLPSVQHRH